MTSTRFTAVIMMAAFVSLSGFGCNAPRPVLFDCQGLTTVRSVAVLPFADTPDPQGAGSGKSVTGVTVSKLMELGEYEVKNLPPNAVEELLARLNYNWEDRYDPVVARAVAKELGVDAVISGEVCHYGAQTEMSKMELALLGPLGVGGETTTTMHFVALSMRLVSGADDGRIIYTGRGTGMSPEGFLPAAEMACNQSLAALSEFFEEQAEGGE